MAEVIGKLHTEVTVGTSQFAAGIGQAQSKLGGFSESLQQTQGHLGKLANRMDRGDIVNGFTSLSTALGTATGAGEKFGNFMSGFALSAATGGIAGAAFGAGIGAINLGLEAYNERAEQAKKKSDALTASWKAAQAVVGGFEAVDRRRDRGLGGPSLASEMEDVQEAIVRRREALRMVPKVYDKSTGSYVQADDFEFDSLVAREAVLAGRLRAVSMLTGTDIDKQRERVGKLFDFKPGRDEYLEDLLDKGRSEEQIRMEEAERSFYAEFADYDAWVAPAAKAAKAVAAAAFMNPAIIAGSQADLEMQARLEAEEQTDYLREIAENTRDAGKLEAAQF